MQMVERPWGITVVGTATVTARPDVVRIRFSVSRFEMTPAESFAATTEAVGAVRQVLGDHGVPDEAVEESQLHLRGTTQGYDRTRRDGYTCWARFVVRSGDLEDVQPLLVALVAAGADEIEGLDFDVAASEELRVGARRQAVEAGLRKAELYADAAGVRLGAVQHIEDLPPERGDVIYALASGESMSRHEVPVPGQVVVGATVILGFAIDRD